MVVLNLLNVYATTKTVVKQIDITCSLETLDTMDYVIRSKKSCLYTLVVIVNFSKIG